MGEPSSPLALASKVLHGIDKDVEDEESGSQTIKKRRLIIRSGPFLESNAKPTVAKFVEAHLGILRSLYQSSSAVDDDSLEKKSEDAVFRGSEIWMTIERFLRNRTRFVGLKRDSCMASSIHTEARRHASKSASAQSTSMPINSGRPNSLTVPTIHASPLSAFTPHGRRLSQGSTAVLSPAFASLKSNHEIASSAVPTHFYVVANLLKRRHNEAESIFALESRPFQALLKTTNAHIVAQQRKLYDLQQSLRNQRHQQLRELVATNVYKDKSKQRNEVQAMDDEPETLRRQMADLECKIRLWSLLAQDLRDAIAIDP